MDHGNACKEHNTYKKYNKVMLRNRRSEGLLAGSISKA